MARVPSSCPPAFLGHYTVVPGDTFYRISQIFRIRMETLAASNPHIPNPNVLFPGDILCVPGFVSFPRCILLEHHRHVPFGTGGTAFVNFAPQGGQAVSFLATLPQPMFFGNYDVYTGEILIPDTGSFMVQLYATPEDPPTWSGRLDLPTAASILPNSYMVIKPYNSISGISGPIILDGVIRL